MQAVLLQPRLLTASQRAKVSVHLHILEIAMIALQNQIEALRSEAEDQAGKRSAQEKGRGGRRSPSRQKKPAASAETETEEEG